MLRSILCATFGLFVGFQTLSPAYAQTNGVGAQNSAKSTLDETLAPQAPFRIVGFGDSLMAGYRLNAEQSFTSVLERKLREKGYDVVIDNAGVSGDTTTGGLARIDWSVPDDAGLVILELGANDMLRAVSPEVTEKNLDAMLARLKERNIPVILAGMLSAPNMGGERTKPFNEIYPRLAAKYRVPLYPFFLDGVSARPAYLLDDALHPNAKGVELMTDKFMDLMETTLASLDIRPVADDDRDEGDNGSISIDPHDNGDLGIDDNEDGDEDEE